MSNVAVTNQSGLQGGKVINSGSGATSGTWVGVQVVNDAVLSAITNNLDSSANLTGVTIPAGITIFGRTTEITVTSGLVIAYNSSGA